MNNFNPYTPLVNRLAFEFAQEKVLSDQFMQTCLATGNQESRVRFGNNRGQCEGLLARYLVSERMARDPSLVATRDFYKSIKPDEGITLADAGKAVAIGFGVGLAIASGPVGWLGLAVGGTAACDDTLVLSDAETDTLNPSDPNDAGLVAIDADTDWAVGFDAHTDDGLVANDSGLDPSDVCGIIGQKMGQKIAEYWEQQNLNMPPPVLNAVFPRDVAGGSLACHLRYKPDGDALEFFNHFLPLGTLLTSDGALSLLALNFGASELRIDILYNSSQSVFWTRVGWFLRLSEPAALDGSTLVSQALAEAQSLEPLAEPETFLNNMCRDRSNNNNGFFVEETFFDRCDNIPNEFQPELVGAVNTDELQAQRFLNACAAVCYGRVEIPSLLNPEVFPGELGCQAYLKLNNDGFIVPHLIGPDGNDQISPAVDCTHASGFPIPVEGVAP
jgi:hypothetical protein